MGISLEALGRAVTIQNVTEQLIVSGIIAINNKIVSFSQII